MVKLKFERKKTLFNVLSYMNLNWFHWKLIKDHLFHDSFFSKMYLNLNSSMLVRFKNTKLFIKNKFKHVNVKVI